MSYDTTGIQYFSIPNFKFAGGTTKDIKVAYRSFNPASAKGTALIPTCYGGLINETLNFTSGALKYYNVVVVAMLGNGESSSPSNDEEFPAGYSLRYQESSYIISLLPEHYQLLYISIP
jgi:homoserine O-acetyltransferase